MKTGITSLIGKYGQNYKSILKLAIPIIIGQLGGIITGFLYVKNVLGAILLGIIITMVIGIPMGGTEFQDVLSSPESIKPIFCQFQLEHIWSLDMLAIVFTFLFIDMFDTVGTLVGVCVSGDSSGTYPCRTYDDGVYYKD